MTYIPPENRDTRYDLWHVRYDVVVPFIRTLSIEQLEEDGLPTSGDKHHDHAMMWEPKRIAIPIEKMVDMRRDGVNISLVNRTDAIKIYQAITRHLSAWKEYIEHSFHTIDPPTDDLLALDEFATLVYDHAKLMFNPSFVQKHLKINNSTAVGRRAVLEALTRADEKEAAKRAKAHLELTNIHHIEAVPAYRTREDQEFIDYSGKVTVSTAPTRKSMAAFFKKEKR